MASGSGYDWETHRETCYRLYIDDDMPIKEVMEYMKTRHDFTPSKRSFQAQFQRWNFPSKHQPAYKDERLVQRVKELWDRNLSQGDMIKILHQEDFDISPRELTRLRTQKKWFLRQSKTEAAPETQPDETVSMDESMSDTPLDRQLETSPQDVTPISLTTSKRASEVSKQKRRLDSSGAKTRYPSDMTNSEACQILELSNETYKALRREFEQICIEQGIATKAMAGHQAWERAKSTLIQKLPDLQRLDQWIRAEDGSTGYNALDILCRDVIKRKRTKASQMSIEEAKTVLRISPSGIRAIRRTFQKIASEQKMARMMTIDDKYWAFLKMRWIQSSSVLRGIRRNDAESLNSERSDQALKLLARDVLKRGRDHDKNMATLESPTTRVDLSSELVQGADSTISPEPSSETGEEIITPANSTTYSNPTPQREMRTRLALPTISGHVPSARQSRTISAAARTQAMRLNHQEAASLSRNPQSHHSPHIINESMTGLGNIDHDVDLNVVEGATPLQDLQYIAGGYMLAPTSAELTPYLDPALQMSEQLAIYIRLHPSSDLSSLNPGPMLWITSLASYTMAELKRIATEKHPGTICVRVEGLIRDSNGRALPISLQTDEELGVFISHGHQTSPMFNVLLASG